MWALISIAAGAGFGCVEHQCAGALQRCQEDTACNPCYNERVWGLNEACLKKIDSIFADELLTCTAAKCELKKDLKEYRDPTTSIDIIIPNPCGKLKEGWCPGNQMCMWGEHAGCEEGTCRHLHPLCTARVTDYHCACPGYGGGDLFDEDRWQCVPAAECEQKEHPTHCGPDTEGSCPGDQICWWDEHAGCEEGTCRHPHPLCTARVTNYHCACPAYAFDSFDGGDLFDEDRNECVPAVQCGHDVHV